MNKTIGLCIALALATGGSAHAELPSVPPFMAMHAGDDGYGIVISTDGATFDGVALIKAVRTVANLVFVAPHHRGRGTAGSR
jgi:hypothetical protein